MDKNIIIRVSARRKGVLSKEEGKGNIVTVFPDNNKKYLSTDLSKTIDNNDEFISNKIELLDYEFV